MNEQKLLKMSAGLDPWSENFGTGMERRGRDGMSWYDLSINLNSAPCEPELAIIVTSWMGQLKWLKATLTNYRLSGALVILAYDNPFYPWAGRSEHEILRCMPNVNHYLLAHHVVVKHITYDSDKRNGWFWNMKMAQGLLKNYPNIKHVYFTNGDCICEKPQGFKDLISYLGEAEICAGQNSNEILHTADVICKVEAFHKIFDRMLEYMRTPILGSRSPELMLHRAVHELGIKIKYVDQNPLDKDGTIDMYARYAPPSTFKDLIGFRNLFAEQETAWNLGLEPLPASFIDPYLDWLYFGGEEKETICKFWETKDRRYLMMWWDRGEDSDYNRLYYPLNHYGLEPIYE